MLIINGTVCDPYSNKNEALDIRIKEGVINRTAAPGMLKPDEGEEVIDASGLVVSPGFMDVHVHFRDPGLTHKEDIFTGAKAAARGGFTSVILMANTAPTVDNEETLKYVLDKGSKTDINIYSCAAVTKGLKGETLTDMEALKDAGAAGFTDDGIPIMNPALLKEAFVEAARLNLPVSLHEEDKSLISENGINRGEASNHYGISGSPREAEYTLVKRDTDLAIETGAILNIQHISAKESVDIVREGHKKNPRIYAEVTPHHLALTEKDCIRYGVNAKMNPPLRTEADRLAIIEGVKDGTISIIATDHAPHAKSEKEVEITKAPSGITGLETAFSVAYKVLVEESGVSLMKLIEMLTKNPGELYNMPPRPIEAGKPADLVLIDTNAVWTYDKTLSKSSNTPFLGKEMKGKIVKTICKGRIAYEEI